MSRHPDLAECLYLVRNGVPFDIAFTLPTVWRRAFSLALGEVADGYYAWQTLGWDQGAAAG